MSDRTEADRHRSSDCRPTHDKELSVNHLPLDSLVTPSGVKVTVMLEELPTFGYRGAEYDARPTKIEYAIRSLRDGVEASV